MEIYIPTRGRVFQETYASLPPELAIKVMFVVGSDEPCLTGPPNRVLRTPIGLRGIGPTRQWIIDNAKSDKVVMLDDDLVFATRRTDDPTRFRTSTHEDIRTLFSHINATLDRYAHVGVATREGGNRDTSDYSFNTRLLRILCYRVDVLRKQEIRFDRLEFMEDFDVTLQLLRLGYSNCKVNWIVHNQRSSNAPGGCSTYRTLEKQSAAAWGLKNLHPEFVKVVEKTTKTAWNGATRNDVRIQWAKAFNTSGASPSLDQRTQSDNDKETPTSTEAME